MIQLIQIQISHLNPNSIFQFVNFANFNPNRSRFTMSMAGLLPSGVPDLSLVEDFIHTKDADVIDENGGSISRTEANGVHDFERKLHDFRTAQSKTTERTKGDDQDDEPIRELYFVRLPKPDFDSEALDLLQKEFEKHMNQANKLAALRQEKISKKQEARKDTNKAWECLKEAKARVYEKKEALKPYRDQTAETRKARTALNDSKRGLAVSTEAQLNQLIRDLTFRLEHETIPLSEEKAIAKELTQLEGSRTRVRQLEAKNAAFNEQISQQNLSPRDKAHLEKELKELKSEQELCEKMHKELKAVEEELNEEIEKVSQEMKIVVAKKNNWYKKLSTARGQRKEAKAKFQENRDFSNQIRDLVQKGSIEEAQFRCYEQTNEFMKEFVTNDEIKEEYLRLWEGKRANPMAAFEKKRTNQKQESSKKTSTLHGNLKVLPGQSLPDAVVADVLRDADAKLKKTPNKKTKTKPIKEDKPTPPVESMKTEIVQSTLNKPPVSVKPKKTNIDPEFQLPAVIAETAKAKQDSGKKPMMEEEPMTEELDSEVVESREQKRQEAKDREAERRRKREDAAKRKKEREEAEQKVRKSQNHCFLFLMYCNF